MIDEKYMSNLSSVMKVEGINRTGLKIVALEDGYSKLVMPLEGNVNHVGIMYAGSLFTLGEVMGGIMWGVMFDVERFFPIVKEVAIRFTKPALSDILIEKRFNREETDRIQEIAKKNGKADYEMILELKNNQGDTVSIVKGLWQIRKSTEHLRSIQK